MIQTAERKRVAPVAPETTQRTESFQQNSTPILPRATGLRHLEMTPAMSQARIMNTTIPSDFEHVEAEETLRQSMLRALREWSVSTLARPVHTQYERIRLREELALRLAYGRIA